MQNVKNFIQGKALGVAEYLTPILKVILHCLWVTGCFNRSDRNGLDTVAVALAFAH